LSQKSNEGPFRIVGKLRADLFYTASPFCSEKIKPEAVLSRMEGLRVLIVKRFAVGGQAGTSSLIEN
jgi:hypothetical protein